MKKILFTLTILLLATGSLVAQEITNPELKIFIEELRAPGNGPRNESKNKEKGIYAINSVDEKSYKALSAIIEKYDIYFAEEIFGMELMFCTRESGSQTIIFQGDTYGLAIADYAHSQILTITIVKGSAVNLHFKIGETGDVEIHSHEVHFNNRDGNVYLNEDDIRTNAQEPVEFISVSETENIGSTLPSDITNELFDHYMPMVQEVKEKAQSATSKEELKKLKTRADSIRKAWQDEITLIDYWIDQRVAPGEVKIPSTGKEFIVIPQNARSGIYEWINSICFCNTDGQTYNVLTATEIAMLYTTKKKEPCIGWNVEGYSDGIKARFASEIPGNEPAYLYRRSTTALGYERMKNDLEQFFYLDGKDDSHRYKGFRLIERVDTDDYCFLHLYDDCTNILIYDCPGEKHCQMDIIVGGIEAFNDALNDISINGKRGFVKGENIIISDGNIELIEGEVKINGVTYDSGVHFTTGYMEKLK